VRTAWEASTASISGCRLSTPPAADGEPVAAEDVDPERIDRPADQAFADVQRDPAEMRGLEPRGQRPRPGEVARVVDEDARPVEDVVRAVEDVRGDAGARGARERRDAHDGREHDQTANELPHCPRT